MIEPQELVDKYIEKIQLQQLDIYKTQHQNELKKKHKDSKNEKVDKS